MSLNSASDLLLAKSNDLFSYVILYNLCVEFDSALNFSLLLNFALLFFFFSPISLTFSDSSFHLLTHSTNTRHWVFLTLKMCHNMWDKVDGFGFKQTHGKLIDQWRFAWEHRIRIRRVIHTIQILCNDIRFWCAGKSLPHRIYILTLIKYTRPFTVLFCFISKHSLFWSTHALFMYVNPTAHSPPYLSQLSNFSTFSIYVIFKMWFNLPLSYLQISIKLLFFKVT